MYAKNEGPADRVIRVVLGIVLLVVGLFVLGGSGGSVAGIVVAAVSAVPLATGATGRCPTYVLLGISTLPKSQRITHAWN